MTAEVARLDVERGRMLCHSGVLNSVGVSTCRWVPRWFLNGQYAVCHTILLIRSVWPTSSDSQLSVDAGNRTSCQVFLNLPHQLVRESLSRCRTRR